MADFGITKEYDPDSELQDTFVGTHGYLDPLINRDSPKYTPNSDIWSAGIVLHELLFGYNSYSENNNRYYKDN